MSRDRTVCRYVLQIYGAVDAGDSLTRFYMWFIRHLVLFFLDVLSVFVVWFIRHIFTIYVYLWYIYGLSMVYLWSIYGLSMVYHQCLPMFIYVNIWSIYVYLWYNIRLSMVYLCLSMFISTSKVLKVKQVDKGRSYKVWNTNKSFSNSFNDGFSLLINSTLNNYVTPSTSSSITYVSSRFMFQYNINWCKNYFLGPVLLYWQIVDKCYNFYIQ